MATETPTARLASVLLREPVLPWIHQRRDAGKTWRAIADDLRALTGGQVDVPIQTLINWTDRERGADQPTERVS